MVEIPNVNRRLTEGKARVVAFWERTAYTQTIRIHQTKEVSDMEEYTIGQRIAARRKDLGLSQIELGERMGVSRQSVSKWESDAAIPEIDKLIGLSKLFGVNVGWLLGVEGEDAPALTPEQTFTDREWELIHRLTQEKPRQPRWLLPLVAGAAAVSAAALLLSGAALHACRNPDIAAISESLADLSITVGAGLQNSALLRDYSFRAEPRGDFEECTFYFTAIPVSVREDSVAELLVVEGGEVIRREKCGWDGLQYTAQFTLPSRDGYTASFRLTDKNGMVRTIGVTDSVLTRLGESRFFGNVSVEYASVTYDGSSLELSEIRFDIDAPDMLRDLEDIWDACDLVILGDGQELGRVDVLNRSARSKQINFSEPDVRFYTHSLTIPAENLGGFSRVDLVMECRLMGDLDLISPVAVLQPEQLPSQNG